MSALATAASMDTPAQPTLLFVDDEQRVLKSMRAMFRKDFNVQVANSGAEALEILETHDIDVVVSDQRMPEMTGVEVLSAFKDRSPETVRILLTGYADLAAVEASINDAEVYKYLMKPCPADQLRGAVDAGLELRSEGQGVTAQTVAQPANRAQPENTNITPIAAVEVREAPAAEIDAQADAVELLVLSEDAALRDGLKQACTGRRVHYAVTLDEALEKIQQHGVGVLVTDWVIGQDEISDFSTQIRHLVPEMVIILASERSDANALISLINSGQVFRFLLKPLQVGQCKIWLASAFRRFAERGGQALAAFDEAVAEPSAWIRFKNWLLGV